MKMEIERPCDKWWKPCPFCGSKKLMISYKDAYYSIQDETGSSCVYVRCPVCKTEMTQFDLWETNYETKMERLRDKWNYRVKEVSE